MTKMLNFSLKIKGGGREGGTCEVLRPCLPPKIWNVQLPTSYHFNRAEGKPSQQADSLPPPSLFRAKAFPQ